MERALLVDVTTYGFLHAGVEPLRREVLKRTWPLLPGWTLFGALQAALIRLDGPGGAGPTALLDALVGGRLRFTPLVPDQGGTVRDAYTYCRQAARLLAAESGQGQTAPQLRYQTTPHAPIARRHGQIQGSLLYAVECHGAEQRYRGWVFCDDEGENALRRGLALLPFLPFGGKGKFTAAEAMIAEDATTGRTALEGALAAAIAAYCPQEIVIRFVAPVVVQGVEPGLLGEARSLSPRPPRRYRVWRTGVYPDAVSDGGRRTYGVQADATLELAWQEGQGYLVGQTSESVVALPEGSTFVFDGDKAPAVAAAFVRGLGRRDWASTGWGQFFVQFPDEGGAG